MDSTTLNESFSKAEQRKGEEKCLLGVDEEKESAKKETGKRCNESKNEVAIEEESGDVLEIVKFPEGENFIHDIAETKMQPQQELTSFWETPEKRASLAEPEEISDSEELEHDKISLHDNFDIPPSCKECFEILDRSFRLDDYEENFRSDSAIDAKMFDENRPGTSSEKSSLFSKQGDEVRSSRYSVCHSHESLPSLAGHASKHSLTLDLECRICHDNEGQDLISPCHCAGTSKWVHESCIIRWIRHAKSKQCEICTCPIKVKRKKKPIDQWTRPSASCGPCNKLDIWYCCVIMLCVFIIISFVVLQHRYDVTDQIETTVIFASIYVLCGMIIMMKLRYFWTWFTQRSAFWGNWKNLNEEWRIIEASEPNVDSPV